MSVSSEDKKKVYNQRSSRFFFYSSCSVQQAAGLSSQSRNADDPVRQAVPPNVSSWIKWKLNKSTAVLKAWRKKKCFICFRTLRFQLILCQSSKYRVRAHTHFESVQYCVYCVCCYCRVDPGGSLHSHIHPTATAETRQNNKRCEHGHNVRQTCRASPSRRWFTAFQFFSPKTRGNYEAYWSQRNITMYRKAIFSLCFKIGELATLKLQLLNIFEPIWAFGVFFKSFLKTKSSIIQGAQGAFLGILSKELRCMLTIVHDAHM